MEEEDKNKEEKEEVEEKIGERKRETYMIPDTISINSYFLVHSLVGKG